MFPLSYRARVVQLVRTQLNDPSAAVRLLGDNVEVHGFPRGVDTSDTRVQTQWYFYGSAKTLLADNNWGQK